MRRPVRVKLPLLYVPSLRALHPSALAWRPLGRGARWGPIVRVLPPLFLTPGSCTDRSHRDEGSEGGSVEGVHVVEWVLLPVAAFLSRELTLLRSVPAARRSR